MQYDVARFSSTLTDPRGDAETAVEGHLLQVLLAEGPVQAGRITQAYLEGMGVTADRDLRGEVQRCVEAALDRLVDRGVVLRRCENVGANFNTTHRLPTQPSVRVRELGPRIPPQVPLSELYVLGRRLRAERGSAPAAADLAAWYGVDLDTKLGSYFESRAANALERLAEAATDATGADTAAPVSTNRTAVAVASAPAPGIEATAAPLDADVHIIGHGQYRLIEHFGYGGMSRTWLAEEPMLQRKVVIKTLPFGAGDIARQRLNREATSLANLTHQGILTIYRWGEDSFDGGPAVPWIATEYIEGGNLEDHEEKWDLPFTIRVLTEAAAALQAAHALDVPVIHRDVKPANLFRYPDGRIVVGDFGIAAYQRPAEENATSLSWRPAGTLRYMSPEQLAGDRPHPHMDTYGLAATAYHLITGAPPFGTVPAENIPDVRRNEDPAPVSDLARFPLPRTLAYAIDSVLRRQGDPERRDLDVFTALVRGAQAA